jgi:GntR family transcriptional regulator
MAEDPRYRQIAHNLRSKIEAGELAGKTRLPTEAELMDAYNASRNTVRDAVKWLITRGLVETQPGRGTFVVEKRDPLVTTLSENPETGLGGGEGASYLSEAASSRRKATTTIPRVEINSADPEIAAKLAVPPGEQLISRHQVRSIDNVPWSMQTTFYPMDFVTKGAVRLIQAGDIEEGTVRYLADTLDIQQNGYRDTIAVRAPDPNETNFFSLPSDGRVSVVEISRVAFDQNGHPFRLTVTVFPADRNQFEINVGKVPSRPAES